MDNPGLNNTIFFTKLEERLKAVPAEFSHRKFCKSGCTILFGFTSNMISTGMREIITYLVKNKFIDCIVTSCGAIEEDLIKCMSKFFLGEFSYDGAMLRSKNINRTGNMLISNDGYCHLEDILLPILDRILVDQICDGEFMTISDFNAQLGDLIDDESSFLYWANKVFFLFVLRIRVLKVTII